jgi:hypothetical protein
MPVSMFQASIPVFSRGLTVISTLLAKAVSHASQLGLDPVSLVEGRLAPDMLTLAGQVQRASDTARFSAARLADERAPSFADDEASFNELQQRITKTIAYLKTIRPEALEGSETREIGMFSGENRRVFRGDAYLLTYALPSFFFHVATAHDILRHKGVAIGKRDYLGPYEGEHHERA